MKRQSQGARNWRCRHRQQMGLQALSQQAIALAHPESVLFINHNQPKPIKLHWVLQQGVGAHQQLQLTVDQILQQLPPSRGWGGACEKS